MKQTSLVLTLNCLQRRFKLDQNIRGCVQHHNHIVTSLWSKSSKFLLAVDHPFFLILNVIFIALFHAPSEQCLCFSKSELRLNDLNVLALPLHNIHPAYLVENSKAFMLWIAPSTMSPFTNPHMKPLSTNSMFSTSLQPLGSWLGHAIWTSCFLFSGKSMSAKL